MKESELEQMKSNYINISIPEKLDFTVRNALQEGNKEIRRDKLLKKIRIAAATAAAATVVLTAGVNVSPILARTLAEVPVVGPIVQVLTFREYTVNEDTFDADIKVPAVKGLKNKDLENSLNEKYLEENKKLYEEFVAEMESLKKNGGGHLGVDSGYIVKTDTDKLLSVGRYIVNTVASSSTKIKYDTVDKEKGVLITLPSLFKNDRYVDIISANIKKQMVEQHKADENKYYWVEGVEKEDFVDKFEKISPEQSFYINPDNKLVISFDKYEVAPGYMGVVEFVIPTEKLSDILVSNTYIK